MRAQLLAGPMPELTRTQTIDRPIDEVFTTIADGGNYASWNPTIRGSRKLTSGQVGNGARFEWELRGFGKVVQEVQEFEPNRQLRFVPHLKSLGGGHRFVLSTEGNTTRINHELTMTPKGLFRLFTPLLGWIGHSNLRATAEALQAHLEER